MPELPEVETVRNTLKNSVLHKTIKTVHIYYANIIENDPIEFKEKLEGQKILDIDRKGKFLIFKFRDFVVVSHLRMEGKFYYAHDELGDHNFGDLLMVDKHTHIVFEFSDHTYLTYNDTRKFGRMILLPLNYMELAPLNKLGKEPFYLTKEEFFQKIHKSNKYIKQLLLDQSIIAGLGNIYCDEVLNLSRISPFELGKNITLEECDKLIDSSIKVLNKAINLGGSTIRSYHSSNGVDGKFQNELRVYGREGKKCLNCGNTIIKTFIGGRGTHFCPVCQKLTLPHNVLTIGLTGLMGSGKTTVSNYLKSKNIRVIDADEIVKKLYLKGNAGYKKITSKYKDVNLTNNEGIDHDLLRDYIILNNIIDEVNDMIHPLVIKEIKKQIKGDLVVLDVPLLFESKLNELCDLTVCVSVSKEVQLDRLFARNKMPIVDAKKLIKKQMKVEDKYFLSDVILDNNGDLNHLYKQVDDLLNELKIK